jgi:hypothetical protein
MGQPNGETMAIDTEADNTIVPRNEDTDVQPDTGKEDRASESGLSNMDRESTSGIEAEMGIALPRGLDEPSGDQYLQAETDPIQEREMGDPLGVVGDAYITTDNAPRGHNSKQMDLGDSVEDMEQPDDMEVGTLRSNEADTGTRYRKQHRHNGSLVKHRRDTEASVQLEHDITTGDYVMGADTHTQEETGRIEILAGESEGRGHSTVKTEENSWQNTKDSPDLTTREQAVKEREAGKSETPLEAEREKNTVTCGVHENRDPEIEEDRHTEPSSDAGWRKLRDAGQGPNRSLRLKSLEISRKKITLARPWRCYLPRSTTNLLT